MTTDTHSHVFTIHADHVSPNIAIWCEICNGDYIVLGYDQQGQTNEQIADMVERFIALNPRRKVLWKYSREALIEELQERRPRLPTIFQVPSTLTGDAATRYMRVHRDHVYLVANYLRLVANALVLRAVNHDNSKFEEPEFTPYALALPAFEQAEYGSPEYAAVCEAIAPAIRHHVTNNSHHPEFHGDDGVDGMTLFDVVEMLCDWMAACQRGNEEGTSHLRLDLQQERFKISDQLLRILINTVRLIDDRFEPTAPNVLSIEEG